MSRLDNILSDLLRIDLLHIDIQGGEHDLIAASQYVLAEKVAYLIIGTHSRVIDGDLVRILTSNGWKLEFEKPSTFRVDLKGQLTNIMDGTQAWRNPRLVSV